MFGSCADGEAINHQSGACTESAREKRFTFTVAVDFVLTISTAIAVLSTHLFLLHLTRGRGAASTKVVGTVPDRLRPAQLPKQYS
jgi:hypothetical protein